MTADFRLRENSYLKYSTVVLNLLIKVYLKVTDRFYENFGLLVGFEFP